VASADGIVDDFQYDDDANDFDVCDDY
jgi:hypothetical protein